MGAPKICMYCGRPLLKGGGRTTNAFFGVCGECFQKEMAKNDIPKMRIGAKKDDKTSEGP